MLGKGSPWGKRILDLLDARTASSNTNRHSAGFPDFVDGQLVIFGK